MANTFDVSTYIQALETAKEDFAAAVKGVDVRAGIVAQADAIIDIAEQLVADLNSAVEMSLAVPDTTLTQQGKPAEAKATGEALEGKLDINNQGNDVSVSVGKGSHAEYYHVAIGEGTRAGRYDYLAIGCANEEHSQSDPQLITVGNGEYDPINETYERSNAATLDFDGNAWFAGTAKVGGSSYANASELATKAYADSAASAVAIELDAEPTRNSQNGVTSAGIYSAIEEAIEGVGQATSVYFSLMTSNNIATDAASTTKVPSVNAIKDYVDGEIPNVPTNVSSFTNDAGYLTQHQSLSNYYTKTETDAAIAAAIGSAIGGSY